MPVSWLWLKIKQEGLRRLWPMFPLTRVAHFGTGFLSHSQLTRGEYPMLAQCGRKKKHAKQNADLAFS